MIKLGMFSEGHIDDSEQWFIANDKTYSYVFDQGSGDCPAGCINHDYKGFQTDGQPGGITSLGAFSNQSPAPAWFTALSACTKWL